MRKTLTTQEFIDKAIKVHGNLYDYSKVIYVGSKHNIIITCFVHGDFIQEANSHLKGHGCSKCSLLSQKRPGPKGEIQSTEKFINSANKIHNNKYDYSKTRYLKSDFKVIIICSEHGKFLQAPNNHLKGQGCPKCVKQIGYSKTDYIRLCLNNVNSDPKVYIIRCFNDEEEFIKIGLTCVSIFKRFQSRMPYSYEILKEIKGSPDFCYDLEKFLHYKYKDFKHKPSISFGGETECYTLDVLKHL